MRRVMTSVAMVAGLGLAVGCLGEELEATPEGPTVTLTVASLGLSGVGDVVWDLEVVNGKAGTPDVVWQRRVASSRYGDGAGSASYVGPCDATPGVSANTVRLWVVGVYSARVTTVGTFASGAVGGADGAAVAFENPTTPGAAGSLSQTVTCVADADRPVRFHVALMRPASQGFFDIAVNFNDIFCSAKFDCCAENAALTACGSDIKLLHDGGGERSTTFVLGFACTAGTRPGADTQLYLDALELDCTAPNSGSDFAAEVSIDPSVGPGNLCTPAVTDSCAAVSSPAVDSDDYLYQVATYRGVEQLTSADVPARKVYWNVALGVVRRGGGVGAVGIEDCRLRTRGTADDALGTSVVDGGVIAAGVVYPYILWDVDLGACRAEPLSFGDPGASVRTAYTSASAAEETSFAYGYGPNLPPAPFVEAVSGACGSAHEGSALTAPTALCSTGTPSAVTGEGPWAWSCVGSAGGGTASCGANRSCEGTGLAWTVDGSSCDGVVATTDHGGSATANDASPPATGSRNYGCDQGTWSGVDAGTCSPAEKIVFVSSSVHNGNLGGLAGADAICQSLADGQPALAGRVFKAWLSSSTTDVRDRMTQATVPYRRTDGAMVASDWAGLVSGQLLTPIAFDEAGALVVNRRVWANTKPDGTRDYTVPGSTCADFTSGVSGGTPGGGSNHGFTTRSDCGWTQAASASPSSGCASTASNMFCSNAFSLYCIQQ